MAAGVRPPLITTAATGSRRPGLAAVGLCLFGAFSLGFDNFLSPENLTAIGLSASVVLIAAVGLAALLISGNLDLSIGSQYALISVVVALVARETGSAFLAVVGALLLGLLLGLLNGWLVQALNISPLIVTLATLAIYRGLAFLIGGGVSVSELPDSFTAIGREHWLGVPLHVIVAALVFVAGAWILIATVTGLRLFAIGGNRASAGLVGVPVNRLVIGAFAANGGLIGLAAVLDTAKLGSGSPVGGVGFELVVLTAVILGGVAFTGGRGHLVGVLAAVLTLEVLDSGLIFAGLSDWYQLLARGSLLLLALTADQILVEREQRRMRQVTADGQRAPNPRLPDRRPPTVPQRSDVVVEAQDVTVRFAGAKALSGVNMRVSAGEVICLVGDNGAGKSTLAKVLCGALSPALGQVLIDGQKLAPQTAVARRAGVETVFQEMALCPNLNAADNLALGLEPRRRIAGILPARDVAAAHRTARARLDALGVDLDDLGRPVRLLSGGERQIVQILRAMRPEARLVILDEPTVGLGLSQAADVLRLVRGIAARGQPVILITHDVEEVFAVADRVVVLQRGEAVFDGSLSGVTKLELLRLMSGRSQVEAARIMAAADMERKQIQRNLHDGAQQQLVNAALMLQLATERLGDSCDEDVTRLLRTSLDQMGAAVGDLRDLSRGISPVILSEYGLVPALESLVRSMTLPVKLEADELPRIDARLKLSAYFVAAEALTNVMKHAQAEQVTVSIRHDGAYLRVTVADDGVGGVDRTSGTGLRSIRDRVEAEGGELTVASPPGAGTQVSATFPVSDPHRELHRKQWR